MLHDRHHRCPPCGEDFPTDRDHEDHVERRHPKEDLSWWSIAESPECALRFSDH